MSASKNNNNNVRFRVDDIKKLVKLRADLEHIITDFQEEKEARRDLEDRVDTNYDELKDDVTELKTKWTPTWMTIYIAISTTVMAAQAIYIIKCL